MTIKKKRRQAWIQAANRKKVIGLCIAVNIVLLSVPVITTIAEGGWFSKAPIVTTEIEADKDAPVLSIVADSDFKPRSYRNNETGEWAGADVEVVIEAANRLGMRPEIVFSDWVTARNTLINGDADIILGLEIFSNMGGVVKTIPISNDKLNVYGKEKVKDAASLAGKKVGLMAQSVIITMFELNCDYVEYYTNTEILQALADGEVEYAICHGSIAQNIMRDNDLELEECFTLMESYPAIGVSEKLPELRDALNTVLFEMADDGTIQRLEKKWVTSRINHRSFTNVIQNNIKFYIVYFVFLMLMELMLVVFALQSKHYRKSIEYNDKIREQYRILTSMAKMYVSMHLISLKENKATEYSAENFIKLNTSEDLDIQTQMSTTMKNIIVPEMQESALEFTDLTTIAERMGRAKVISKEFLATHVGWIRAQFVAAAYDEVGELSEVVFTTLSIDREKEREQYLIHISKYDELTGIYNRRAYEEDLGELRKTRKENIVVISFDLDGLKTVNDQEGHQAGDSMLQQAVCCINEVFSQYGKLYRVGGDEFIALIQTENMEEMPQLKEKFFERLREERKKTGRTISISCGYASYAQNQNAGIDDLVMMADKNMYQEKILHYKTTLNDRRNC